MPPPTFSSPSRGAESRSRAPQSVRRAYVWSAVAIALVLGTLLAEFGGYARNTLRNHPAWASGKLLLADAVMGAGQAFETRNLLHGNRLNLGEWHGFNQILLNRVFALGELEADVRLAQGAYVHLLVGGTAEGARALRLSRSGKRPPAIMHLTVRGELRDVRPVSGARSGDDWHRVRVRATEDRVLFELDGAPVAEIAGGLPDRQVVGFWSGLHPVTVDNVRVTDAAGAVVIDEGFSLEANAGVRRLACIAGVLLLVGAYVGTGHWLGADPRRNLFRLVGFAFVGALVLLSLFAFDRYWWSARYPYEGLIPWRAEHDARGGLESFRRGVFAPFSVFDAADAVGPEARVAHRRFADLRSFLGLRSRESAAEVQTLTWDPAAPPATAVGVANPTLEEFSSVVAARDASGSYDVAWLGTSQTWGSGAAHGLERLASRATEQLYYRSGGRIPMGSFNFSRCGSYIDQLVQERWPSIVDLGPDVIVLNLGNNDHPDTFEADLRDLVVRAKRVTDAVLVVLEAKNNERVYGNIRRNHAAARRVAGELAVPVFDLHAHLLTVQQEDRGLLFWDPVHLTSFGQKLAGEALAAAIVRHFGAPRLGS